MLGAISGLGDLGKRIVGCRDGDKKRRDKRAESMPLRAASQQKQIVRQVKLGKENITDNADERTSFMQFV